MKPFPNDYHGKAYRFLSYEGLFKTVESEKLRFTRVDSFNDPLDNSPYLIPYDWDSYSKGGDEFLHLLQSHLHREIFQSLYICCFSKKFDTFNSYLMWSHYCKSHSQVCFEIDFKKCNYLGSPTSVKYPKDLISVRNSLRLNDKMGLYLTTTKSRIWSYEKEVRLLVDILHPKIDFSNVISDSDEKHLSVAFNPGIISKVIFGAKSNLFNETKTIRMFYERGLKPDFIKMVIDPITLNLKSEQYKFKK